MLTTVDNTIENQFPEGKIVLMDGRELACHPLANDAEVEVTDDNMKLDTTGLYLAPGRKHFIPKPTTPQEVTEQRELFIDNAFYLLAHKERILSDSLMYLCPIAIQSGLAYTGTSGFGRPTLGIYIEWWLSCAGAMQIDENGHKLLVYRLAGSPLSGSNRCSVICEDGKRKTVTLLSFNECWASFTKINGRYHEAKSMYQAYNLQQVLNTLKQEDNGNEDFSHQLDIEFLTHEIMRQKKEVDRFKKRSDYWHEKYKEALMKYNDAKIRSLYAEYEELGTHVNNETQLLNEQRKELKARLKSGQIDNIAYQRQVMPLNKRIKELSHELYYFKFTRVNEVFPDEEINFDIIEQYINNLKNKEL